MSLLYRSFAFCWFDALRRGSGFNFRQMKFVAVGMHRSQAR